MKSGATFPRLQIRSDRNHDVTLRGASDSRRQEQCCHSPVSDVRAPFLPSRRGFLRRQRRGLRLYIRPGVPRATVKGAQVKWHQQTLQVNPGGHQLPAH